MGGFFLCTVPPCGYTLATTTRQYESPVAHGPPAKTAGGLFAFTRNRSRRCPAGPPSRRSLSPPRHVSTCRLRLTPPEENPRGALSFYAPAAHVASQVPEPAEGPASPCAVPSRALPGFSRGVLRTGVARPAPASVLLPFPPAFCIFHTNDQTFRLHPASLPLPPCRLQLRQE